METDKIVELKIQLNRFIIDILKDEDFKEKTSLIIKDEITNIIVFEKDEFFNTLTYKDIKAKIKNNMLNTLKSQSFKEEVNKFLDYNIKVLEKSNKTLGALIPPAFINGIKVYIYNNHREFISSFKKFITKDEITKRINKEILNILNGINPMVSRFISPSTINTRMIAGINDYLDDPKNIRDIINMINGKLDEIMKKKISEIIVYFPSESRKSIINSVSNGIIDSVASEKFIDIALNKVEEKLKEEIYSLNESSSLLTSAVHGIVDSFMLNYYPELLDREKSKELINEFSSSIVESLLEMPLKDFI